MHHNTAPHRHVPPPHRLPSVDTIDLIKTAATSLTYNNGVLDVMNGSKTVAALAFTGTYTQQDFVLGSDGHGGSLIIFGG